jgi:hypothetical protein
MNGRAAKKNGMKQDASNHWIKSSLSLKVVMVRLCNCGL